MLLFSNLDIAPPERSFITNNSKRAVMYISVSSGKFVSALMSVELRIARRPFDRETTVTLNRYMLDARTERWK